MYQCPKCGKSLAHKDSVNRHLKKYCYANSVVPTLNLVKSTLNSDVDITTETTTKTETVKKVIKLKNVASVHATEVVTSVIGNSLSFPTSTPAIAPVHVGSLIVPIPDLVESEKDQEIARLRKELKLRDQEREKGSLTINQTIINQTINQTVNIFNPKCLNLYDHVLGLCDGDVKRTISKIYSLFKGKKTKKNKYDHPELEKLLPNEVFGPILKRAGKDVDGNYKYEYAGDNGVETCGTEYVDKVIGNIIVNGGLLCYNKAIEESNKLYENEEESNRNDRDGGATDYLINYGGIYGNQDDDLMTKAQTYMKTAVDPKHMDNTIARITNRK
jgi:hypothetical protein